MNVLIEKLFPNLAAAGYEVTSPGSLIYNCIAWAAGDDQQWWEPLSGPGYYWPEDVSQSYAMETLVKVYERLGYSVCEDRNLESGYEKVALYGNPDGYTHAARQLADGRWTSKLGPSKTSSIIRWRPSLAWNTVRLCTF